MKNVKIIVGNIECQKFIKKNSQLNMNEIFWWDDEKANTKAESVLNIHPPFWQPANSLNINAENLYDCYYNCFKECIKRGKTKSISFPLIGAGTFMYPIKGKDKILESVINNIDASMFEEIRIVFWKK